MYFSWQSDANGVLPSPCYSAPSQSLSTTILPLSIVRYSTNTSTTIQGYPIRVRVLNASHLIIRKHSLVYRLNSLASIEVVLFSCRKQLVLVCSLGRGILRECRVVVVHHLGIPKATIDRRVRWFRLRRKSDRSHCWGQRGQNCRTWILLTLANLLRNIKWWLSSQLPAIITRRQILAVCTDCCLR